MRSETPMRTAAKMESKLTPSFSRWDGSTLMFDVESTGCMKDRVHKDVCLTLL